jgi:ElaB/YqjD/DUF883 family membrane-anchored ribosome-binding protein
MSESIAQAKKEVQSDFASDYDALKKNFTQLREDVTELVNTVAGAGRHGASSIREQISTLKDRGADSIASIEESAEDHPVASALILVGIGFLAAHLLHRR